MSQVVIGGGANLMAEMGPEQRAQTTQAAASRTWARIR